MKGDAWWAGLVGGRDWRRGMGREAEDGSDDEGGWVLFNDFSISVQEPLDVVSFQA